MRRFSAGLLVLAMALGAAGPVFANPLDTFGYTAKGMALGGAMTAAASSFDATYYNPAGLGMLKGFDLGLGAMTYKTFLTAKYSTLDKASGQLVRQSTRRNDTVRGSGDVGIASPVPLGKGLERVLFLGASVVIPGTTLYAVRERPIQQPYFPFMEDRNRRLVLNVAAAGRWKWLMVGAGFTFIPSVKGRVNVDFTDGGNQNLTEVDVGTRVSPNLGVLVEPVPGLTLGLTWRGENRLDLSIPVSAVLADNLAPVRLKVTAVDYSTPHQIALGAAYRTDRFLVTGDVTYSVYRRFRSSAPDVILYSSKTEVLKQSIALDPGFHDTWAVRVGGEFKPLKALALRAGFAWIQSPVPAQTGVTNLLDGDRYVGSVGLGFDAEAVGGPAITVDAAMSGGYLVSNRDAKDAQDATNPGYPWVGSEGWYLAGALSAKVRF